MPAHAAHHDDHEIETLEEFDAVVSARGSLAGFRVQAVDLTDRTRELLTTGAAGAVFLGCPMREDAAAKVRAEGALVFPPLPDLPFDPYRGHVYTPDELFASLADGYAATPDARAYAWLQRTKAEDRREISGRDGARHSECEEQNQPRSAFLRPSLSFEEVHSERSSSDWRLAGSQ